MFTIKNAIKNIHRNRTHYKLFGTFYFVIICLAAVFINMFVYSNNSIDKLKIEYGGTLIITQHGNFAEQIKYFNLDNYMQFNDSRYVESVKIRSLTVSTGQMGEYPSDIEKNVYIHIKTNNETRQLKNLYNNAVYFTALNFENLTKDEQDKFILSQGRIFENSGEAVIAVNKKNPIEEWNLLGLGDTVTVTIGENLIKEYAVVGILQDNEAITANAKTRVLYTTFDEFSELTNILEDNFTSVTMGEINNPFNVKFSNNNYTVPIEGVEVVAELKSCEDYYEFHSETSGKGYTAEPLNPNVNRILHMLDDSRATGFTFTFFTCLIIIVSTVIITIISLSNRKYEIAVLRSVGMKKSQIIFSYFIENLVFIMILSIFSLIISPFISNIFISFKLSGFEMSIIKDTLNNSNELINLVLMFQNTMIVFGVTIGVVILSLMLACINIVRFEPLKIFNKQY